MPRRLPLPPPFLTSTHGTMTYRHGTSLLLIFALLGALAPAALAQEEVVLEPSKDNTLYETNDGATSNGSGTHLFAGRVGTGGNGAIRRALIAFDLSSIPTGATIESAELTITMSRSAADETNVTLHRVERDWGEGSSDASNNEGRGADAATDDATWLHAFFDATLWNSAGGDFETAPSATAAVNNVGAYTWGSTAEMVADVQGWVDDPATNFGWLLRGNESTTNTAKRFDSREAPNTAPTLTVRFSTATATEDEDLPGGIRLLANHPNPFTGATTLAFQLDAPRPVRLEVFDVLGRRIDVLVDEVRGAGLHRARFDASRLPQGLYLYRLTAGSTTQHRTMTVIK